MVVDSADSVDPDLAASVQVAQAVLEAAGAVLVAAAGTNMAAVMMGPAALASEAVSVPVVVIVSSARRSSPRHYCSTGRLMPLRSCNGWSTQPTAHLPLLRTWQSLPSDCSPAEAWLPSTTAWRL